MDKEKLELDKLDKKILTELDLDSRQSISKLSKKLNAARSVIDYKIRRMEKAGLIQNYVVLLDPGKLGVMIWNIYLEFHNLDKESEDKIIEYIKQNKKVWWAAKTAGNWNFIYSVVVKNIKELEKISREFNTLFGNYILKQVMVAHGEVDIISRSFLKNTPGTPIKWFENYSPISLDKNEKSILSILGCNSRSTINEISEKTNLDPKTVASKIKKLKESKIIVRNRLQLDLSKIGLNFYKVIVFLRDYNPQKDKKLLNYCIELGNIFHFERKIGPWPLEFEMDVQSYENAEELMQKLKEKFPDFVESYDLVLIKKEIVGELDLTKFI